MIVSERVMMALSAKLGKGAAHKLIYEIGNESREQRSLFEENVRANETVQDTLSKNELDDLFNVHTYVGKSEVLCHEILERYANFTF